MAARAAGPAGAEAATVPAAALRASAGQVSLLSGVPREKEKPQCAAAEQPNGQHARIGIGCEAASRPNHVHPVVPEHRIPCHKDLELRLAKAAGAEAPGERVASAARPPG
jgi:hypothetical protein